MTKEETDTMTIETHEARFEAGREDTIGERQEEELGEEALHVIAEQIRQESLWHDETTTNKTTTMTSEQASRFLHDYMIDPVPDGAVKRLVDADLTTYPMSRQSVHDIRVGERYVDQDHLDAIISDK